jgi:hypothetical protein
MTRIIDVKTDTYKGFNDKTTLLATYRWYCLHYDRHLHGCEYDSFEYPSALKSPSSSPRKLSAALASPKKVPLSFPSPKTCSPSRSAHVRDRSSSPSKARPYPRQTPNDDPFVSMGTLNDSLLLGMPHQARKPLQHWVVFSERSAMISTDR